MNQGGGTGGLVQHQQMQSAADLPDPEFDLMRNIMRGRIFEYLSTRQSSPDWLKRIPDLSRRVEQSISLLFPNKNDYFNMMKGPVEQQVHLAIKNLSMQNNQKVAQRIQSSSTYGNMIPTPGFTQGASGNSRIAYVMDNTGLPSGAAAAAMVPQTTNMGNSLAGSISNKEGGSNASEDTETSTQQILEGE